MSEQRNVVRESVPTREVSAVPSRTGHTPDFRIDTPHAPHDVRTGFVPLGEEFPAIPTGEVTPADCEPLLEQARQIADYLHTEQGELSRREQQLTTQLSQLDQERREIRLWVDHLESQMHTREAVLAEREAAAHDREEKLQGRENELRALQETLHRERGNLEAERACFRHEIDEQRGAASAEIEHARAEFRQEKLLQENRFRFQQDHLQKARQDFETSQIETRFELQVLRAYQEQYRAQLDLRSRQLAHFRDILQEREQSLNRERETLGRSRNALDEAHQQDQARLARLQSAWEMEREQREADLRRQHDLLTTHAGNLEARRQRLDQLRAELEETNRQTLELRVAVEEAYAQLAQAHGAKAARTRVDEARNVLVEYYRHTRDSLFQQRQEIDQAALRAHEQRQELAHERQSLRAWVLQQEERLRQRAADVDQLHQAQAARDDQWRQQRDRWVSEKLQAETLIRRLLQRLSALEGEGEEVGLPRAAD